MINKRDIYSITLKQLEDYLLNNNHSKFKAKVIFNFLYKKKIRDFKSILNIGKELIALLENDFYFSGITLLAKVENKDFSKYLFGLNDHNKVEAVLMRHDYGNSLCISTQVGCNMGCTFCESGRLKKVRNLTVGEMIRQVMLSEEIIQERISHVVLMGIGEPMDNFDNVIDFIEIIKVGLEIGARHITVSTCGIVPKIIEFGKLQNQVNLAISLHAPNDKLRSEIMVINKAYPLVKLIAALKEYIKITNRRITFEYIMLDGINDSVHHARELANLIRGLNAYVNLIPYNSTSHSSYKRSTKKNIDLFYDTLKKEKISVTVRREFGSDSNAACGQLRSNYEG